MERYLSGDLARFFREISAIPRGSRCEGRIADYLQAFAKERGLFCYRDRENNVLIKRKGSVGRENELPLLLQSHTDMVQEVAHGVTHDFASEGVFLQQEENVLSAKGTTLGADDGFGVALMLAALDRTEGSHPPLECLFTSAEEIGLVGATAFDYSHILARRMLNLDSAEEDRVIIGCCGGIRSDIWLDTPSEAFEGKGLLIGVHGLFGGHSGEDIHRGRANALCVLGGVLSGLSKRTAFRIAFLHGGDKDNAIPRDCEALILPLDAAAAATYFADPGALIAPFITSADDAAAALTVSEAAVKSVFSDAMTNSVLRVMTLPNGVLRWDEEGTHPVTSRNLASVRTDEGGLHFTLSSRSPMEEEIDALVAELERVGALCSARVGHRARYPGWCGEADSPVCTAWRRAYRAVTGKESAPTVLHAGLECGLISARLPGLDVISVGCNVYDLHTPAERMELDSLDRIDCTMTAFLCEC